MTVGNDGSALIEGVDIGRAEGDKEERGLANEFRGCPADIVEFFNENITLIRREGRMMIKNSCNGSGGGICPFQYTCMIP